MARVTEKELYALAESLSGLTGTRYRIEFSYGSPRLVEMIGDSGAIKEVSPRLPKGELSAWLWAFRSGIYLGMRIQAARDGQK